MGSQAKILNLSVNAPKHSAIGETSAPGLVKRMLAWTAQTLEAAPSSTAQFFHRVQTAPGASPQKL